MDKVFLIFMEDFRQLFIVSRVSNTIRPIDCGNMVLINSSKIKSSNVLPVAKYGKVIESLFIGEIA